MKIAPWVEKGFHRVADALFRHWPQALADPQALANCRLVAHRGAHGHGVRENTPAAFDRAADAGLWGIELDIRWSADLVPVVFHDADTRRLFGRPFSIRHMTIDRIEAAFPLIPRLETVLRRYGGRVHLMVEIKAEPWPDPAGQNRILERLFSPLRPGVDFHLLALDPALFSRIGFVPPATFLPVAETNTAQLSALALQRGWAGIAGHYLLTSNAVVARHRNAGQQVGTGYIHSQNSLFREINRKVTWMFTNRALAMQEMVGRFLLNPAGAG